MSPFTSGKMAFAEAESPAEADYMIYGIPYDATTTFNPGCRFGPDAIRLASWNMENFTLDLKAPVPVASVYDAGNGDLWTDIDDVRNDIDFFVSSLEPQQTPIVLGGEHSISPLVLASLKKKKDMSCAIVIDAHLDYRDEYLGNPNSHACAVRRMADVLGAENIIVIGARSADEEEYHQAKADGLNILTAREMEGWSPGDLISRIDSFAGGRKAYLSIDLDGIDPAYAPGVGTPEPYGISPQTVRNIIMTLAPRIVAMDIVEYLPSSDPAGATGMLAAEFIRRFVTLSGGGRNDHL